MSYLSKKLKMKLSQRLIILSCLILISCTNQSSSNKEKIETKPIIEGQISKLETKLTEIEDRKVIETEILPAKKEVKISAKELFPVKIEFGAIGKGSKRLPTTFEIRKDSVLISYRDQFSWGNMKSHSTPTKKTKFVELFSSFFESDFAGEKSYHKIFIRDGGFMRISNKLGQRSFANVFSSLGDKSRIRPDTIGLSRFEAIKIYSNSLIRELNETAKEEKEKLQREKRQKSMDEAKKKYEKLKQEN